MPNQLDTNTEFRNAYNRLNPTEQTNLRTKSPELFGITPAVTPTIATPTNPNVPPPVAPDFTITKRETTPSSFLMGGQSLTDLLSKRRKLEQDVLTANKPTALEQDLTQQFNQQKQLSRQAELEYRRQEERLSGFGGATKEQTTPFISETAKSYQRSLADIGTAQSGIADQLNTEIAKRTANVDFATGLLKADKENLALISDLQKATRPDVLSTQVNDLTGDVTAFTQDPTTGAITSNVIGNVGAKKQYAQSGTYQDASGNQVFWGLSPTGQIETKNLGGGGGTGGRMGEYSSKQITAINKINENVSKNATYAKTSSMRNFADNVVAALSLENGIADISAINQFQKVIDEGAVTRDQDVKLISSAQSLANSLKTKIKKLESGDQLSPDQRSQMRTLVENLYDSQVKALLKDPYISAKNKEAELYGITPADTILGELGAFNTQVPKQPIPPEKESIFNEVINQAQDNKKSFGSRFLDLFR